MQDEVLTGLAKAAKRCSDAFASEGLRSIARVIASERAIDVAVVSARFGDLIIRCVPIPTVGDAGALATMLAEGDFTRAFIVYADEDQPHLSSEIESYPLSRIDELAASLARKSDA